MKCTGQERAKQALVERERLKDGTSAYEDIIVTKKRGFWRKAKTTIITKEVGFLLSVAGNQAPFDTLHFLRGCRWARRGATHRLPILRFCADNVSKMKKCDSAALSP